MHAYLYGLLISAFIADILKNQIKQEHIEEYVPPTYKPESEGIKVKDGDAEIKVILDQPNYTNNYDIIPLTIQYWYLKLNLVQADLMLHTSNKFEELLQMILDFKYMVKNIRYLHLGSCFRNLFGSYR
jgi:hypothetical protein